MTPFFARMLGAEEDPATRGPLDDYWYNNLGEMTLSGARISPANAMHVGAVYACVRVIAESIMHLPLVVYRRLERGKERAPEHPLHDLFTFEVNEWMDPGQWLETMVGHVLLRGNSYWEMIPAGNGYPQSLIPLHPDRVEVEQLSNRRLRYQVRNPDGTRRTLLQHEVFHVMGPSENGIVGDVRVSQMRETIGVARTAEAFAAEQFGRRPMMAGFLTTDGGTRVDLQQQREIAESLRQANSGVGRWQGIAVLSGLKWQDVGMTSRDAQFLETRKFQKSEIASWFRVPPHMIGDLERSTNNNIEQQSIDFVRHTLMPWLKRIERAITRQMLLDPKKYSVEFLVDALLRGTTKERAEAHQIWLQNAVLVPNEVRAMEGLNPREGGDEPLPAPNASLPAPGSAPKDGAPPAPDGEDDPDDGDVGDGRRPPRRPDRKRRPPEE